MIVIDLIIALQKCDSNWDVIIEVNAEQTDMFKMVSIETCEPITVDNDLGNGTDNYVLISPYNRYEHSNN